MLLRDEEQLAEAKRTLTKNHPDMNFVESDSNGRYALIATFTEQRLQEIRNYAVEQNITILRNRVNELVLLSRLCNVKALAASLLSCQVFKTARAKEILGATATLEFREVDDKADLAAAANGRAPAVKSNKIAMVVLLYLKACHPKRR